MSSTDALQTFFLFLPLQGPHVTHSGKIIIGSIKFMTIFYLNVKGVCSSDSSWGKSKEKSFFPQSPKVLSPVPGMRMY